MTLSPRKNDPTYDQEYKDRVYEDVTPQLGCKLTLDHSVVE